MKGKCEQPDCKRNKLWKSTGGKNLWMEGRCLLECFLLISVFSYFFYRSYLPLLSIFFIYPIYRKYKKRKWMEKRKKEFLLQFKGMLHSLLGSVKAGYSLENAIREVCKDMKELHGKNSMIVKELVIMENGIKNNQSIEQLMIAFGMRSGVEEINQFAAVLAVGKRYGGAILETMENTIDTIDEKISVEQEIDTMLQAKEYELKVMEMVPFAIILYVDFTSKNYFSDLYHTMAGIVVMTIGMLIYLIAVFLAEKIIHIQI